MAVNNQVRYLAFLMVRLICGKESSACVRVEEECKKSAMKIRDKIRELNLNRCSFSGIDDIVDKISPMING